MKKNKKEKKINVLKIKESKKVKISSYVLIFSVILIALLIIIGYYCPMINDFIWFYLYEPFSSVMFYLFSGNYIYHLFVIILLFILFFRTFFILNADKMKQEELEKTYNNRVFVLTIFITVMVIINTFQFVGNSTSLIDSYNLKEQSKKEYTISDAIKLRNYLYENVNKYVYLFDRDKDGKIIYDGNINDLAINNLEKMSNDYHFMSGIYPRKVKNDSYLSDGTATGLTQYGFFSVFVPDDLDITERLVTIMHEYSHVKGLLRESDATFMSILAGINSNDDLSKYSSYKEALNWVDGAIIDMEKEDEVHKEIKANNVNNCLINNYNEYCLTNNSTNYKLLEKYDDVRLETYYFKYYSDKDKIKKVLEELNNSFDLSYIINGSEIEFNEISNHIDNNPNEYLEIVIDTNKNNVDKLYDYLDKNIKNYELIYDYGYDIGGIEESDNPIDYYLHSFNKTLIFNFKEYSKEYNYERVIRLLLEYYDSLGLL